ncbi:hypothetical protein NE237_029888 [Protea cynaroides]|uniref:Uncharacterized protein n=1 Tax=Protea cynaroides TaxID=273540 RepID=A0A9Q0JV88_9MAGN|nr:hypothetical protein NE237_029888 [Protea cynaroides]
MGRRQEGDGRKEAGRTRWEGDKKETGRRRREGDRKETGGRRREEGDGKETGRRREEGGGKKENGRRGEEGEEKKEKGRIGLPSLCNLVEPHQWKRFVFFNIDSRNLEPRLSSCFQGKWLLLYLEDSFKQQGCRPRWVVNQSVFEFRRAFEICYLGVKVQKSQSTTIKISSAQVEVEFAKCKCYGLIEECTPCLRDRYHGRRICDHCADVVKDESFRLDGLISAEEALH